MIGLLLAEVRRFWSRRLLHVLAALGVLAILVASVILSVRSEPELDISPEQRAHFERRIERCERGKILEPTEVPVGTTLADLCAERIRIESFGVDDRFHLTVLADVLEGSSLALIIAAWLLGASSIGAEWHAGTVATLLTWEPRRVRVLAAKLLACCAGIFLLIVALQAILGGAFAFVASLRGTTEGANAAWYGEVTGLVLRVATVCGLAGAIGFAIASIGRNTAAALGVGFLYLAAIEGLVRALRPAWQPWLLGDNAALFIVRDASGLSDIGRSPAGAGLLLATYAAGLFAVAVALFRRRDVH
ncbi:MAG: hypothetical protein ACT4PO_13010 [Actinomycetota bacterium]